MKIDNYTVQMNAQYYNLQLQSTQAKVSTNTQEFNGNSSLEIENIQNNTQRLNQKNRELSAELSKAVLKNINSESRKLIADKVQISQTSIEAEALNFSVDAKVVADGKELDVSLDVALSRSFVQKTEITVALVQQVMKDPLVVSLDGGMPALSSKNFSFDIDSDGEIDQISRLKQGSGFLALDKNSNGKIDNGLELFGAKSGDGFADLSKYDDDNNGWIDENDKMFDKLRIWQKTDDKDELIGLGEVGIGAIFLGNSQTPFSIKSASNETLGEIRNSGFVLFENGRAGVISHIDLAVQTKDNLTQLETIQKDISLKLLGNVYNPNKQISEKDTGNEESNIEKIQAKIKTLEAKLASASDEEKVSIQMRIGVLLSQMISLLEV